MTVYNLVAYMGGRYRTINASLLRGQLTLGVSAADVNAADPEKTVFTIDKELDELGKPMAGGVALFRRAGMATDYAAAFVVGQTFTQASYLSSSRNEQKYGWNHRKGDEQQQVFFTLTTLPQGFGRDVAALRGNANEAEILFHRRVNFLITATATDGAGNVHVEMTEANSPNAGYVWGAHRT
jgi:hypothetical protein